jgi:hypothetical protein
VLTGEGEDVAWHGGEEVRSKVQASMVGSAKGSVGEWVRLCDFQVFGRTKCGGSCRVVQWIWLDCILLAVQVFGPWVG